MPKQILYTDDDPTMTELAAAILEDAGYSVIIANRASVAVGIFSEQWRKIDLVLIDAKLPGTDGPALRRVLKQMNPDLKAAYVTGLAEAPDDSGTPCLYKPFLPQNLLVLVKGLIGNPQKDSPLDGDSGYPSESEP